MHLQGWYSIDRYTRWWYVVRYIVRSSDPQPIASHITCPLIFILLVSFVKQNFGCPNKNPTNQTRMVSWYVIQRHNRKPHLASFQNEKPLPLVGSYGDISGLAPSQGESDENRFYLRQHHISGEDVTNLVCFTPSLWEHINRHCADHKLELLSS